jgi:hypothetical protein
MGPLSPEAPSADGATNGSTRSMSHTELAVMQEQDRQAYIKRREQEEEGLKQHRDIQSAGAQALTKIFGKDAFAVAYLISQSTLTEIKELTAPEPKI